MRRRLVATFVGMTLVVVLLFGTLRAIFVADLVTDAERDRLERSLDLMVLVIEGAPAEAVEGRLAEALRSGERLEVSGAGGTLAVPSGSDAPGEGDLVAERRLAGGTTLTLSLSADVVRGQVRDALLPMLVLALLLLASSGALGAYFARRLARPFRELALVAETIGSGPVPGPDLRHDAIPEARAIATALRESHDRVEEMLRREREVATHASHELRTPITAVRLSLEDLALWPQTDEVVAAELQRLVREVDRLAVAVTELLDRSRDSRSQDSSDVDLAGLVREVVSRAEATPPVGSDGSSTVEMLCAAPLRVRLDRTAVARVLELLVRRAMTLSSATVTVECADGGAHVDVMLRMVTGGAGAQRPPEEATELALALGGRLAVQVDGGRLTWTLMLPAERTGAFSA